MANENEKTLTQCCMIVKICPNTRRLQTEKALKNTAGHKCISHRPSTMTL